MKPIKINERHITRDAAQAALLGVPLEDSLETCAVSRIGHQPVIPPKPSRTDTGEDQKKLAETDEKLAEHPSPTLLYTVIACLFLVEAIGCSLLMESLGYENPARIVFGIMFAAVLFLITYLVVAHFSRHDTVDGSNQRRWPYVILAVYVALVISVTVVRLDEMQTEEGSFFYDIAAAIVLMFLTTGLAWLAELVMRRLAPTIPPLRARKLYLQRIDAAEREYRQRLAEGSHQTKRKEQWKMADDQLRAIFKSHYANVQAVVKDVYKQQAGANEGITTKKEGSP